MHEALRSVADSALFGVTAAPYLVLDANLRIQAANPAYLGATGRSPEELIGAFMFDAFPDNPADPDATGVRNLSASLERVLRRSTAHDMGVQRYDIPDSRNPGVFRTKTWGPVNSPLTDNDGHVVGALHHVEDITAVQDLFTDGNAVALAAELQQPSAVLRRAALAAARYDRALASARAVSTHRDVLWHRIVHAAREARRGGCAAAVCAAAAEELPGIDAVAVTLRASRWSHHRLAASEEWAGYAEELQLAAGEGPSIAAFLTGKPVLMSDLSAHGISWPDYTDAASELGIAGVFAFPLQTADRVMGTLTCYRRSGHVPSAATIADAEAFAEMASVVLRADLDTDFVIDFDANDKNIDAVAAEVLAEAHSISLDEAFRRMRIAHQVSGRRLAEIARDVLARHTGNHGYRTDRG
ncbi:PAS domain-containing protein [Amycolatopsis sp. NPDC058986]|uniref:PAS domain-containing protein n=1 Tax=unclassified Amycolatopsis TaxID=2618356 RepID=UPI003670D168